MSSQNKLVNPTTVHLFCFFLRWVFMVSFIVAIINWTQTVKLIDFVPAVLFLHWSITFHLAEKLYQKDLFSDYNRQVAEINSMPRWKRRKIIVKYQSKLYK